MKEFLAMGTLTSGDSFRYADLSIDMITFLAFLEQTYPDFEVEACIEIGEYEDDDYLNSANTDIT